MRLSGAPFALDFVTVRLQPQMKKYRCPWYVSTTNHNILYFVGISRTCSLNTAICLWKVANGPVWRGVARSVLRWNRGKPDRKPGPAPIPVPPSKRSPSPSPSQGPELVQNSPSPVRIVDNGGGTRASLCPRLQTGTRRAASVGAGRGRCESLQSQCDRTLRASQPHTGATPAELNRTLDPLEGYAPGNRSQPAILSGRCRPERVPRFLHCTWRLNQYRHRLERKYEQLAPLRHFLRQAVLLSNAIENAWFGIAACIAFGNCLT